MVPSFWREAKEGTNCVGHPCEPARDVEDCLREIEADVRARQRAERHEHERHRHDGHRATTEERAVVLTARHRTACAQAREQACRAQDAFGHAATSSSHSPAGAVDARDGGVVQLGRRAVEHELAGGQPDDAIGELKGDLNLMQVHEACHAQLVGRPPQVLHHGARRLRVEAGNGLVGQHEQRVLHERAGDSHALHLAARQLVGAGVREVGKAHLIENFERATLLLFAEQAQHARHRRLVAQTALQHVLDGRRAVHEVVVLKHHGDAPAARAQRAAAHVRHVLAVERHRALRGVDEPVHASQQRGLTRARRADDADESPRATWRLTPSSDFDQPS